MHEKEELSRKWDEEARTQKKKSLPSMHAVSVLDFRSKVHFFDTVVDTLFSRGIHANGMVDLV